MKLTENFTLEEMLRSGMADRLGIKEQYAPSATVVFNLTQLCMHILQPLRDIIGQPVLVSSGYRCKRVNKAVGGVQTSQHKTGEAADIKASKGMSNADLFNIIKGSGLPFDQLIWEYGNEENPDWVHVSYSKRHRSRILIIN